MRTPGLVLLAVVALAVGHAMGAPAADTRTAVAMASAIRNPRYRR